ncbi:MAG: transglutaminase domain-containing protein [Planctomycetota bacterium]
MKRARWTLTLVLLLGAAQARAQATAEAPDARYYDVFDTGQKIGYSRIAWRASTWEGRETVHDSTLVVNRGVRDMAGIQDVFDTKTLLEIERGPDGVLYHQLRRIQEGARASTEELSWTGRGYHLVTRIGQDPAQTWDIPLGAPTILDAEAFLAARVGELKAGQKLAFQCLDVRARAAAKVELEVLGRESIDGDEGKVSCLKVQEHDPRTGALTTYWLDAQGAFVRLADDQGDLTQRVSRAKALALPERPATFSITVPSVPGLPRVFNADAMTLAIHLAPAADRALPQFPKSPWSQIEGVVGDERAGFVLKAKLRAYDGATPAAPYPPQLSDAQRRELARDLEPTPLLPCQDQRLLREARMAIGGATELREAAYRLARHVHDTLAKESPAVASTTALEILRERRGDCSEHCVLFVALCRAVGIPARRCSGFVNIGENWGAHDWSEIWVGGWVGADPTTGEVGTKARYLFFGYPDLAGSFPERVRAQATGRMRLVSSDLLEGKQRVDLTGDLVEVEEGKRYLQLATGIELRDVPASWRVRVPKRGPVFIVGDSLRAEVRANADQGETLDKLFGQVSNRYGGAPAWVQDWGSTQRVWAHSRRRFVEVHVRGGTPEERQKLEAALAPTFRDLGAEAEKPKGE